LNKDFSSCASDKFFKGCSFDVNENRMAVVVQRLERAVVVRKTRVQFSPSAFFKGGLDDK
tara:strand:- start:218 stop:397 length:180 start_codon:yes stop_codon:yes gene_type:complete